MVDGEINRCRATGVVSDRNDLFEVQRLDDRFKIAQLLLETIAGTCRFVGSAVSEEIERDDSPPGGDKMRNQLTVDMEVVGETVQEHEGRTGARIVARIDLALLALH